MMNGWQFGSTIPVLVAVDCKCSGGFLEPGLTPFWVGLTRFGGQGRCVDHAAEATLSWWMVASYSAGLR